MLYITQFLSRILFWFLQALYVQLMLMFVYVPLLIAWGLPVSLFGVVGAIIWTPLLIIFLMLSSLLYITHILYIPNNWCVWIINTISQCWCDILSYGQQAPMIGFVQPPMVILILVPLLGFSVMFLCARLKLFLRCILLASVLTCVLLGFKLCIIPKKSAELLYRNQPISVVYDHGALAVDIRHVHKVTKSFCRWWRTGFCSFLYKNFGTCAINSVLVNKTTKNFIQKINA